MDISTEQNSDYAKLESKYYQCIKENTSLKQENNFLRFQIEDFNAKCKDSDSDMRQMQERIRKMKRRSYADKGKSETKAKSVIVAQDKTPSNKSNNKRRMTKEYIDSRNKNTNTYTNTNSVDEREKIQTLKVNLIESQAVNIQLRDENDELKKRNKELEEKIMRYELRPNNEMGNIYEDDIKLIKKKDDEIGRAHV